MPSFKDCNRLFGANKITLLKWPENNPDLNPIENLWAILEDKVANKHPSNIAALIEAGSVKYLKNFAKI